MASTGTKARRAVGSSAWIATERENIDLLVSLEMEEIEYPAQHEMDWLNEHMAEIFNRSQLNVTEIFKTPGKLRGKTPRTVRKHQTPREGRVPLSDIFAAEQNVRNSSGPPSRFNQEIAKLSRKPSPNEHPKYSSPVQIQNPILNSIADSGYHSGYHDMAHEDEIADDDEMDLVYSQPQKEPGSTTEQEPKGEETKPEAALEPERSPEPERDPEFELETAAQPLEDSTIVVPRDRNDISPSVDRRTTDASFHSAREVVPSKESSTVEPLETDDCKSPPISVSKQPLSASPQPSQESVQLPAIFDFAPPETANTIEPDSDVHDAALDHNFDDIGSPSDGSTPDRPPVRKSSLSFASLPAREPLTTKRSMGGARMSRISHIDPSKSIPGGYFGRQTGGARITQILPEEQDKRGNTGDNTTPEEERAPAFLPDESDLGTKATNLHHKSSTQLLHEKINMLGKSQPSRNTKSIPAPAPIAPSQVSYPELLSQVDPVADKPRKPSPVEPQVCDNRTAPPRSPQHFQQPQSAGKPIAESPQQLPRVQTQEERISRIMYSKSPERRSPGLKPVGISGIYHTKSASTSVITSPRANTIGLQRATSNRASLTPVSSPRRDDGPLSASKSKLQSIMKTAKSLFTSSAGVSAAAKMETFSPTPIRTQANLYPNLQENFTQAPQPAAIQSPIFQEGRRTRSSTEREEKRKEKERQDMERIEEQLQKAREQERQQKTTMIKDVSQHQALPKSEETVATPATHAMKSSPRRPPTQQSLREAEQTQEEEHKFAVPAKPQHHPKQNESRRPLRPTREAQKPKPQPVSIRVGTLSQRIPLTNSSLSSIAPDATPGPPPAPKALLSAVNKKGSQPSIHANSSTSSFKSSTSMINSKSKAAQASEKKEAKQRREAERMRVAQQQEEARRQEQTSWAEADRRERERSVPEDPKKLAHKQAIEKRRLENARKLEQQRNQQPTTANDLGSTIHQEKSGLHGNQRKDISSLKGPRLNSVQGQARPMNYPHPNPAKPPKRVLEDESSGRPVTGKVGAAVHQADGKRRKTDDESVIAEPPVRPAMAPPIRQSNVRKEVSKLQMYNQGGQAIFKNPPASRAPQGAVPIQQQPHRNGHPLEMSKFASGKIPFADNSNPPHAMSHKTPGQGSQKPQISLKSSPAYPNGDSIKLPEILTDSEDEDSDAEPYNVPDWAKPENLTNILISQEGQDGAQVFGPSAPLHMEEIFKDNKDRLKRFRDRTSSANWGGPDGLTQAEIKWDIEQRERLKKNGGWTFAP
ncbi:hypothetical protein PABG_06831 [Paracoccidioides brasiliensis Pb03]|nr:hypothetical protein PABG_06831 [Paracoccidioides brasiliensis Pb03]